MPTIEPGDREEMLLAGILNGETESNIEPGSRKEMLLKAILENGGGKKYQHNITANSSGSADIVCVQIITESQDEFDQTTLTSWLSDKGFDPLANKCISATGNSTYDGVRNAVIGLGAWNSTLYIRYAQSDTSGGASALKAFSIYEIKDVVLEI